jgi:hypothetical protein
MQGMAYIAENHTLADLTGWYSARHLRTIRPCERLLTPLATAISQFPDFRTSTIRPIHPQPRSDFRASCCVFRDFRPLEIAPIFRRSPPRLRADFRRAGAPLVALVPAPG